MNKAELIDAITERLGDKKAASKAVEVVVDTITRAVAKGEKVAITGFGVFEKQVRGPRTVRNPATGESIKKKKTAVPKFRPGAGFKQAVSGEKKLPALPRTPAAGAKKAAGKKAAAAPAAKKATATKATTGRATKAAPAKATATKAAATKTTGRKATATKATTTKAAATKATAKKTTAKKAPAKATATKATAKKTATKAPARKATAKKTTARKR